MFSEKEKNQSAFLCNADTALLDRERSKLKSMARVKVYHNGINCYVSMAKANLGVGRYRLWFDLKRDGLRQV